MLCYSRICLLPKVKMLQLFSVDTHLGRCDASMLSDQNLMELLVGSLSKKPPWMFSEDEYADKCTWIGVTCDSNENVTTIRFSTSIAGSIALEYMPPHVRIFTTFNSLVKGTLETGRLSHSLEELYLYKGELFGTVNFTSLPPLLERFCLPKNNFSGSADLYNLPEKLHTLDLSENAFIGNISLTNLPRNLVKLNLSNNGFSGELCFDHLPPKMQYIILSHNKFSGKISLENPPSTLFALNLTNNLLSGTAMLYVSPKHEYQYNVSGNTLDAVVDQNGTFMFTCK